MGDWHEHTVRDTRPSERPEHHLRYAVAAPLLAGAPVWADLGCGTGTAAAGALVRPYEGRLVLVDAARDALDEAARALGAGEVATVLADLGTTDGCAQAREAIAGGEGGLVTCFGLIEHLPAYGPLVELLHDLATGHGATVLLSAPDTELAPGDERTPWDEAAFEELRRLLPEPLVVARQVPLAGSLITVEGEDPGPVELAPVAGGTGAVSHRIAAFGPRAAELGARAHAEPADLRGQRAREAQRDALLAFREAELEALGERAGGAASTA